MSTMSSAPISLETHARRQLMQNTNTQIPPSYLIELQSFLREFPNDLKFTIRKNHLYGMLTCKESGCNNANIPLGNLPGALPGSIGSLHPYKIHIRTHPSHAVNRNVRVRDELRSVVPQRTGSGNGRLLAALSMNASQKPQPLAQSAPVHQLSQSSASVSRKLPGGQVECIELSDSDDSDHDSHKSKRPRLESAKQPLGTKNPNIPKVAPVLQLTQQNSSSQFKQQSVSPVLLAPPVGSPSRSKENGITVPAPSQTTTLQQLEVRRKQLDERAHRYRAEILVAKGRKGAKARRDLDRATNHLQVSLTEAARIDRQVKELSRLVLPVAGPSNHAAAPLPGAATQRFIQRPPTLPPPASTPQVFLDQAAAAARLVSLATQRLTDQLPSGTQIIPPPGWQSRLGDLASATGPRATLVDEDDLSDYDDPLQFPTWNQLQRPITGQRVKATMNDIHSFIEMANTNAFGGEKTVQDALQGLELNEVGDCLPGMEVSLLTHQIIGVNWMKMREDEGAKFARGGILADAMGLGKTVQTIGIMCANPSDDPNCNATLIVAPLALLEQWRQEIVDMTEQDSMKILIYHGPSRPKHVKDVKKYDVVLTTYQTLANEWPDELAEVKKRKPKKKKNADHSFIVDDDEEDGTAPKKKRVYGPLMSINWYRVVLDEAQNIRNARTRASTAVTHVESEIRWCLTGTPLTNGLNDAYGLLRFIQHRPFGDWDKFRDMIRGADDDLAAKRVQHALAGVILRRTKESELDGRKLIELPPRQEDWVPLEFMEDERAIYSFVEARSQAVFNKFLQAGTVLKNYSQILVMLMRLRQICVHPCLLKVYESAYEVKDTRSSRAKNVLEEAARLVSNEYVVHVKKLLRDAALDRMRLEKEKGDEATVEDNCSICFEPHGEEAVVTAPCAHIYCRGCIEAHIRKPRTEEDARFKEDERDCPLCRQTISISKLFGREAFEPTNEELNISGDAEDFDIDWEIDTSTGEGRYKAQAIGKRKHRKNQVDDFSDLDDFIVDDDEPTDDRSYKRGQERSARSKSRAIIVSDDEDEEEEKAEKSDGIYVDDDDSDDLEDIEVVTKKLKGKPEPKSSRRVIDSDSETEAVAPKRARVNAVDKPIMKSSFLPSTKMQYMMKKLLELAKTHPDDKTMVVSQWTSALELCSDYLNEHNIRHVRFQGSMSVRERNEAIQAFMKKSHIKVMLMSLKAGGVGLNLTRGNRVVSLDLGWSNAVDQQAFDRVHRLGQKKEVFIERLVISGTVEQRVQEIQARKQGLSDGALGEGTGQRMRLSVGELAHLFGLGPTVA